MPITRRLAVAATAVATLSLALPATIPDTTPSADAATATVIGPGSYIIDVGQAQTIDSGVRPYGLVYALLDAGIPVLWAISDTKAFDGVDLTVAGRDYRGGPFVIEPRHAPAAAPIIDAWRAQGVAVDGPLGGSITVPVHETLTYWPRSVVDPDNGPIAVGYYDAAGIPATAYREALPTELTPCDDLYAMPHADPEWDTHGPLATFNADGGFLWAACHAVSVLENVDDPADVDGEPDLNFLSATGLVPFGSHGDGTPPYSYRAPTEPAMQLLGTLDAATDNGSEQIYLPALGGAWRSGAQPFVVDDDHPDVPGTSPGEAAVVIQGRGFGVPTNGMVLYEAGHNHQRGPEPDQVAGMRVFFNFHLMAGLERSPDAVLDVAATMFAGASDTVTATATGGSGGYRYAWTSTCGGTFADATAATTTFTAPTAATACTLEVAVTDGCGRTELAATELLVQAPPAPGLSLSKIVAGTGDGDVATITTVTDVRYEYRIENTGDTYLIDIVVVDDLGTPADATDDVEVCRLPGPLEPGGTATCTLDLLIDADTTNVATATGIPGSPDGTPIPGVDPPVTTDTAVVVMAPPPPAPPAPPPAPEPPPEIPATGPAEEPLPMGTTGAASVLLGMGLVVGAHRTERAQRLQAIAAARLRNRAEWGWDLPWRPPGDE